MSSQLSPATGVSRRLTSSCSLTQNMALHRDDTAFNQPALWIEKEASNFIALKCNKSIGDPPTLTFDRRFRKPCYSAENQRLGFLTLQICCGGGSSPTHERGTEYLQSQRYQHPSPGSPAPILFRRNFFRRNFAPHMTVDLTADGPTYGRRMNFRARTTRNAGRLISGDSDYPRGSPGRGYPRLLQSPRRQVLCLDSQFSAPAGQAQRHP